jgi:hypothetical protein
MHKKKTTKPVPWFGCIIRGSRRSREAINWFLCECNERGRPMHTCVIDARTDLLLFGDDIPDSDVSVLYDAVVRRLDNCEYRAGFGKKSGLLSLGADAPRSADVAGRCLRIVCSKELATGFQRVPLDSFSSIRPVVSESLRTGRRPWYGYIAVGSVDFSCAVTDFVRESESMYIYSDHAVAPDIVVIIFSATRDTFRIPFDAVWSSLVRECAVTYEVSLWSHPTDRTKWDKLSFGAVPKPGTDPLRFLSGTGSASDLCYGATFFQVEPGKEAIVRKPLAESHPDIDQWQCDCHDPQPASKKQRVRRVELS